MKGFLRFRFALFALPVLVTATASANPTGPSVANGQVTINQAGNLLSITNSPNSIINWQSFSIGANEITRFTQQSALSAVLNRVVGSGGAIDPSVILGALQSNGRVFLINPSGIVFGAGSQIDVAGLVASSLNLSNADFLGGRLRFTEVPGAGAVVNQGTINAASGGQVYLVGPAVTNSGVITTPQGEVILAAGNSVELVNPGTPNLRVEINAPDNEALNLGQIIASSGRIGIYAGLIKSSGTLNADRAVMGPAGEILLKAATNVSIEGTLSAIDGSVSIEAGGNVDVTAGILGTIAIGPGNGGQQGGVLLQTAGNNTQTGNVTLFTESGSINISQAGSVTLAPGGTISVNNVTVPLSVLSGLGPVTLQPSTNLLTLLPAGQVSSRGTAQVMGGISTISQVNDFTKSFGGASSLTLTPPRTNLVFE